MAFDKTVANKGLEALSVEHTANPGATTRVLVLSGNEAHKWHNWVATAVRIQAALEADPRLAVAMTTSPEDLVRLGQDQYDVLVLNYCNWHDPAGLSESAKENLLSFLRGGGGLVAIHFSNGSFNFSLPEAGASDWPEFRNIVPRVWNHHGDSRHDPLGKFDVNIKDREHPITQGIADFPVTDELYYRQEGSKEIRVLYAANSVETGQEEPLAWTSDYEGARVYQTLLGHCGETYDTPEVNVTLRRGVLWAAGRL